MLFLLSTMLANTLAANEAMDCSMLAKQEADHVIEFRMATVSRPGGSIVQSLDPKIASQFEQTATKVGETLIVSDPPRNGFVLAIAPNSLALRTGCISASYIKLRSEKRPSSNDGWVGKWKQVTKGDNGTILMKAKAGKIQVTGTALNFYKPREANMDEIDASALPRGKILEVDGSFETEGSGCTIRIQRVDPYIVVTERTSKDACSPNNATFTGIYHRVPEK